MTNRLNQHSPQFDWNKFIAAVDKLHDPGQAAPHYDDFKAVHVRAMDTMAGMGWHVHSMRMNSGVTMKGTNFLAWHRWLLVRFERRLQLIDPTVSVPYWNAVVDRAIPAPLKDKALLKRWRVTRDWTPGELPTAASLTELNSLNSFDQFQTLLEADYHNSVHRAVGGMNQIGDMALSSSPHDPIFWLHHAMVDKLWADWQAQPPASNPSNPNETLKPKPLFADKGKAVKVKDVLSTTALGYHYV